MLAKVDDKKWPNPTDVAVGDRVRQRRVLLGMNQSTLGQKIGVTFQQVQKYEKGTNRIGASRMQAIATALQVPPSFFFEAADTSARIVGLRLTAEEMEIEAFLATKGGRELNRAFARIRDGAVRRDLLAMVETLAAASVP